jgi:hypothetical protein
MLTAAAFVPIPPLLVPEIAGGSAAADDPLRTACAAAVRRLCATAPDEIVVVGCADHDGPVTGSWDWRGFGVPVPRTPPPARLPHALAVGAWLLDVYADSHPARFHAVTAAMSPADCADLGRELVGGERRVGLLVCGDGTACRTEKAPGFFDPAAETWDDAALTALGAADSAGLLGLDAALGQRLLAAGRAPWQVLAGAAASAEFETTIDWAGAPYGVLYVAGTWIRSEVSAAAA